LKSSIFTSRPPVRILSIFILMVLAAGVAVAPLQTAAQQSAPVANSSTTAPTTPDAAISKAGATETAAEDENIYRHTPLVQSLAKVLHLDVETTARLFEFSNFAIITLAIFIPLVKIMPKVIGKRSQALKHDLESARKITEEANARLAAVEAKLAKLDQQIAGIRAQVEEDGKHDEERIKATFEEESGRIVAAAEQEIAAAAAQARRGLRHFAADLAIEQAAKQLILTPETDRALIAEFISDAVHGGQN
jgi:F-type H+-transporting ATPase subunit b